MSEIEELRAELARVRSRLDRLEGGAADLEPTDRRGFFKLAVGAAAGAVAATVATAEPAAATTGQPVLLGQFSAPTTESQVTGIVNPSGTNLMPVPFSVNNSSVSSSAPNSGHRVAIYGESSDIDASGGFRVGVMGEVFPFTSSSSGGVGVYGAANVPDVNPAPTVPAGVFGIAGGSGRGVLGLALDDGVGVQGTGQTADAIGVLGETTHSQGLAMLATAPNSAMALRVEGRISQVAASSAGPPSGAANVGEQWRDSVGDLWLLTAPGNPGTWRKVAAQHPLFADAGGSINLLANPFRVVDTRNAGAQNNNGQRVPTNGEVTFAIAGVGGSAGVPAGAKGVLGNVTAVDPNTVGNLSVFPNTFANTSNINYVPNQTTANSFICALNSSGQLKVRSTNATTHVILDIAAFLF